MIFLLHNNQKKLKFEDLIFAGLAQLVEQLICNQQVAGSSPAASSSNKNKGLRIKSETLF
jgi:hypothetical protein